MTTLRFEPLWGLGTGATYAVYSRLTEKPV